MKRPVGRRRRLEAACVALFPAVAWMASSAALAQPDPDPARFEEEIRAFEARDAERPPAPGSILFVGSSSIRMWETLEEDFIGRQVLGRGFGGSHFSDLLHFTDRIVFRYEPRMIFVYEGDNDVASGKSSARVFGDFREFVGRVKERLPGTTIAYLAIKPSRARWEHLDAMREVNALVRGYAEREPAVMFVDTFTPMLDEEGEPAERYYLDDQLHLSPAGYAVWREIVSGFLE